MLTQQNQNETSLSVTLFAVIIKISTLIRENLAAGAARRIGSHKGVFLMLQSLQNFIPTTYASFFLEFCSFTWICNLMVPTESIKTLAISDILWGRESHVYFITCYHSILPWWKMFSDFVLLFFSFSFNFQTFFFNFHPIAHARIPWERMHVIQRSTKVINKFLCIIFPCGGRWKLLLSIWRAKILAHIKVLLRSAHHFLLLLLFIFHITK